MIATGTFTTSVNDLTVTEVITMDAAIGDYAAMVITDVYVTDHLIGAGYLLSTTRNRVTPGTERQITDGTARVIAAMHCRTKR